jgi:sodium-coupled neutral amino acid transporter 11
MSQEETRESHSTSLNSSTHSIELHSENVRRGNNSNKTSQTRPKSPFFRPSTPIILPERTKQNKVEIQNASMVDELEKRSSLIGTYSNLVNAIVGAGIIGIPYAMKETGLVAGILLIFSVALLTDKSLRLLIETGKHASAQSYETLMEAAFGRPGFVFISINMLIMSYGAMIAYLLVLKDTFPVVLGVAQDDENRKRMVLLVSSLVVVLPLSMQRDMADLSKTSTVSVVFDICLVLIIAICSPVKSTMDDAGGAEFIWKESLVKPSTLFVGLGVLSFAFVCQDSSFIIAGSLRRPTKERWAVVTRSSLLTCATLAAIIGVAGYLGFLSKTEGNILNNFTNIPLNARVCDIIPVQRAIDIARGLLGATMFCVYPLASYVARHVLIVLFFQGRPAHEGDDHSVLARKDRRILLTLTLYVFAIIPALIFENLGTVLAATGAVGGSCLSYLGPGAAFIGIHGKYFLLNVASWDISSVEEKWMWKFPKGHGRDSLENDWNASIVVKMFRVCLWYLCFMPLWSMIAYIGKRNFEEFQKLQLEKTPVHRRLGRVVHRNADHTISANEIDHVVGISMVRAASFDERDNYSREILEDRPLLIRPTLIRPDGYGAMCQMPDSLINGDEIIEEDPQDAPPEVLDFALAIFYIVLGTVALFAGLVSISV